MLPAPIVAFLVSTKVPILPPRAEHGARAQVGERADGRSRADHRERRVGALDDRVLADLAVDERGVRADDRRRVAMTVGPVICVPGRISTSGASVGVEVDPGGRRVVHGDAGELPAADDAGVQLAARPR